MSDNDLLIENGWTIECESPFEIRHDETNSFATLQAADAVINDLKSSAIMEKFVLIKDAYDKNLVNKDRFVIEIMKNIVYLQSN